MHIRNLKQALKHGLVLKKGHRIVEYIREVWLKPYIGVNTKSRANAENDLRKHFQAQFSLKKKWKM